jgi:hypothetical protein
MSTTDTPTMESSGDAPAVPPTKLWGVLAEYEDVDHLLTAARSVRDAGYKRWDSYAPFPIHHIDDAMGMKPTVLPWIVLAFGLTGMFSGLFLVWWTNATNFSWAPTFVQGYEYVISGKPLFSLPANIPVIFELTILLAAFAAVFGMLGLNKLPQLHHPLFRRPRFSRVTNDRFFIAIEAQDDEFDHDRTRQLLAETGAVAIEDVEE